MKKYALLFILLTSLCYGTEKVAKASDLRLLISPEEINQKLDAIAAEINEEYRDKELTVVMVMKGAVCVAADLIRKLDVPCSLEYIKASSYGKNGTTRGELTVKGIEDLDLTSKHVLLVDDIYDTGNTMQKLMSCLEAKGPKSLKTLVLLIKKIRAKRRIVRTIAYLISIMSLWSDMVWTIKNIIAASQGFLFSRHVVNELKGRNDHNDLKAP